MIDRILYGHKARVSDNKSSKCQTGHRRGHRKSVSLPFYSVNCKLGVTDIHECVIMISEVLVRSSRGDKFTICCAYGNM